MLRSMRQNMKSLSVALWIVVAAFIGTIFLVWGRGSQRGDKDVIAKVGDKVITYMEYRKAYVKTYEFYRKMFGEKFNENLLKQLHIKDQVFNSLVNDKLIEVVAEKEGIEVYPQEIVDEIARMGAFQTNGKFDPEKYRKVLQFNRLTPEEFEEDVRKTLLKEKVLSLVRDAALVPKAEVRDEIVYDMEKVKIEYVVLTPGHLVGKVKVSPDEIKVYYEKHKEEFRMPERVKIALLPFTIEAFKDRVKVSQKEVEDYYQANKEDFPASPRLHLLVISVKDKKTLKRVLDDLRKENFSQVARKFSRDSTAARGGDMGWVSLSSLPEKVSKVLESLGEGKVSSPVRVDGEYKIFKVVGRKEGGFKPLDEVKDQIYQKLLAEKARKEALRAAAKAREMLKKGLSLDKVARKLGVKLVVTPLLARNESIPGVISSSKVLQVAFTLSQGEFSDIVRTPQGFYIVRVMEKRESYVPPLDQVKDKVIRALKLKKAQAMLGKEGAQLARLAQSEGWKKAIKDLGLKGLKPKSSSYFSRVQERVWGKELIKKAFSMDKGSFDWVKSGGNVVVFRLVDRKGVSDAVVAQLTPRISTMLMDKRKRELLDEWLRELRERIEVKVNQKLWEAL